jgi:2-oxoglutarate ferredoxin oxidoreductase subunit alpha
VILLSDGYLANGSEPWNLPDRCRLAARHLGAVHHRTEPRRRPTAPTSFWPYLRDETLARPWAIPGTPGLMHRVGGLEKGRHRQHRLHPENHEHMVHLRAEKVDAIANDIPPTEVNGDDDADVLVLGWGSTWAAIDAAVQRSRRAGVKSVAKAHIMHLNPLPPDLGEICHASSG